MAELSAVPFSALPQAGDGYTVLYEDNQVCRSEKKLSELVGDKTSSFLTKEQGDSLYQEKGNYLVADDITGKLDKSQYAVDSATFLTAHQDISNKLDTTAFSTVSGDFLTDEDITGKMDKSESANFYPMTGNPSGFLTQQSLDEYATQEWVNDQGFLKEHQPISADKWNDVYETVVSNSGTWETETDWTDDINDASAYAYEQAIAQIPAPFDPTFLSGEIDKKLDKTFSSNFYPMTGNPSGFLKEHQDISNKLDTSSFSEVSGTFLTDEDITGKMDKSFSSNFYPMESNPSGYLTEHQSLDGYATEDWVENKNYLTNEDIEGKLDTSSFSEVSGTFLTAHQDISNKMDKSESANFYPMTGNPSGFLTAHQDISTKLDESAFSTVSSNFLTAHQDISDYATINYVDTEIGKIGSFEVVGLNEENEPDVDEPSTKIIYLTKETDSEKTDPYTEWIYNNTTSAWECIGETTLDLTDYYKKTETSGASEISDAFNAKQDKLTAGTDIVINNGVIGVNTNGSAIGDFAFVEGKNTFAGGLCDHVEGMGGIADNGGMNHIEGFQYHSYCSNRPVTNFNNTNIVKFPNVCPVILRNNERISPNGTLYELVKIFKDRFIVSCDYGGGDGAGIYHYTQNPFYNPELYKIIDVDLDSSTNEILITIDGTINVPGSSNGFIQLYGPTTINSINGTGGSLSSGQTLNTFIFNGGLGFPGNCLDNVRLDNTFISINLGYTKTGEQEQTTISKIIEIKNIEFDSSNNSFTFTTEDIEIPDIVGGGYTLNLYVINSTYNGCNHIEGQDNSIHYGCNSHAEGFCNTITNNCSHVEGSFNYASNPNSHAEGNSTSACGSCSHTEGKETFVYTNASNSHAEGYQSSAYAVVSHAEGSATLAAGSASHSEGFNTLASAQYSHAEGYKTTAIYYAHAEGWETRANEGGHAEGRETFAGGQYSHAEGQETKALTNNAHSEGGYTSAGGYCSHAEGNYTVATGFYSHSEGNSTSAYKESCHAEGQSTIASGMGSHSEGNETIASDMGSHAEGLSTSALGQGSHTEGGSTKAYNLSHAEGSTTLASGVGAHSEGQYTNAYDTSHAEGQYTIASGAGAHAEGGYTKANGQCAHA